MTWVCVYRVSVPQEWFAPEASCGHTRLQLKYTSSKLDHLRSLSLVWSHRMVNVVKFHSLGEEAKHNPLDELV